MSSSERTSPRAPRSSVIQNFTAQLKGSTSTIRDAIKDELQGRIMYDDANVSTRLRVGDVDDNFVSLCLARFKTDISVQSAVKALRELEKQAEASPDNQRQKQEKKMYPHLAIIFAFIQGFPETSEQASISRSRCFVRADKLTSQMNTSHPDFPQASPDFSLMNPDADDHSRDWMDRDGFAEIKATQQQGPKGSSKAMDKTIQEIMYQSADYARLHLSARPFWLFSVGLLIFGSGFSAAIYDRDGVAVSPQLNMWNDTEAFIRLVRALTTNLTSVELGQDPTVAEIRDHEVKHKLGLQKVVGPVFLIDSIGSDPVSYTNPLASSRVPRRWCTIGLPVCISFSLFGRGTAVWPVKAYNQSTSQLEGEEMVMKTAWRQSNRHSESSIYLRVALEEDAHPAIARFRTGGDVRDPRRPLILPSSVSNEKSVITTQYLRNDLVSAPDDSSQVLHRLVLETIGRSIWTYSSDLELMRGIRAALAGHEWLCSRGILHRDISAGNIMLAKEPMKARPGQEGFLTDLELSSIEGEVVVETEVMNVMPQIYAQSTAKDTAKNALKNPPAFVRTSEAAQRGAMMTGTVQFMAIDILRATYEHRIIEHRIDHDLESFIWVLVYAIMRRVLDKTVGSAHPGRKIVDDLFRQCFGALSVRTVLERRESARPLRIVDTYDTFLKYHVSKPVVDLLTIFLKDVSERGTMARAPKATYAIDVDEGEGDLRPRQALVVKPLTHSRMRTMFTNTIRHLEELRRTRGSEVDG